MLGDSLSCVSIAAVCICWRLITETVVTHLLLLALLAPFCYFRYEAWRNKIISKVTNTCARSMCKITN